MINSKDKSLTVMGYWPLQFSYITPYIKELVIRGYCIDFIITRHVHECFPEIIKLGRDIIFIDDLEKKYFMQKYLYLFLSKMLNFICVSRFSGKAHNSSLRFIMRFFFKNPFKSKNILNITKCGAGWLLCGRGMKVFTIMGSWDHPTKMPMGYSSDAVFVWNAYLDCQWKKYQGDVNIQIGYPFIFDYLLTGSKFQSKASLIIYPFTTTSYEYGFDEELSFVNTLIQAGLKYGFDFLIKPKPEGAYGELDDLKKYSNIIIASIPSNNKKHRLYFSDQYQKNRLKELSMGFMTINIGTTFSIDAALYGLPVMQLDFRTSSTYPKLAKIQNQIHIKDVLLNSDDLIFSLNKTNEKLDYIFSNISKNLVIANNFKKYLIEWISIKALSKEAFDVLDNELIN